NEKATVAQFAMALDWLMEVVKENDQVILSFSGHGDVEKKTITQPDICCVGMLHQSLFSRRCLSPSYVQDIISTLSAQNKAKVVVIPMHAVQENWQEFGRRFSNYRSQSEAKQYANEIKILSCQPNEYRIEGEQWGGGRGAFSYHLVDALYGMPDGNNDLLVNLQEAGRYIEDHESAEVAPSQSVTHGFGK
ncbi:MAG: caspase family protein, partial [Saprospiraceae bacterium]|nr:caspase family protein [Candidatus Vicinibacter affinis]